MSMDGVARVAAVVVAVVGAIQLAQNLRPRVTRRAEIKASLELVVLLPTDSAARASLLHLVEEQVQQLIRFEREMVRNWRHVGAGAYLLLAPGFLASVFQSWWIALLGLPFSLLGLWMIEDGRVSAVRDDRGMRVNANGEGERPSTQP